MPPSSGSHTAQQQTRTPAPRQAPHRTPSPAKRSARRWVPRPRARRRRRLSTDKAGPAGAQRSEHLRPYSDDTARGASPWPDLYREHGHWLPCISLAQTLVAAGHSVAFMGIPDCAPIVAPYGYTFYPILADIYPFGHPSTTGWSPRGSVGSRTTCSPSRRGACSTRCSPRAARAAPTCSSAAQIIRPMSQQVRTTRSSVNSWRGLRTRSRLERISAGMPFRRVTRILACVRRTSRDHSECGTSPMRSMSCFPLQARSTRTSQARVYSS